MEQTRHLHDLLISEVRHRLFEESIPRIRTCLSMLTEEEIWHRPNENSNSVGNLVLHLCGNARQWILSGLGNAPDMRNRQKEFDQLELIPTKQLLDDLDKLQFELNQVLHKLTPQDLVKEKTIQGFNETGISILVHVTEHFSYHVGQITYYVKLYKNIDTAYYAGLDLDVHNE